MRIGAFLVLLFVFGYSQAQIKQLYGVDDLPQTLMLNPGAEFTKDKHFGIPLLSGISASAGITGLTAYDIFKEDANSTINDRIREKIYELSYKDNFAINEKLEILSLGWRRENGDYISAGWYQEADAIVYWPEDLGILTYEGNANRIGEYFSLEQARLRGEVLSVFHIGINKKVSDKLRIGARGKLYNSMANFNSLNNQGWFATFETPQGENFYRHDLINAQLVLQTSGVDNFSPASMLFSGNLGVGVDLGFTYQLNRNWKLTGSLVDLGFVMHSSDLKEHYFEGDYSTSGIQLIFPAVFTADDNRPYWQDFEKEFEEQVQYGDRPGESYTTLRPLKLYSSLDYGWGEPEDCNCLQPDNKTFQSHAGVLFSAVKRPVLPYAGLTAYYDTKIFDFLRGKVTYTVDQYSFKNVGLMASTNIKGFNFYIAVDNILAAENLAKANTAGFQLGLQIIK